MKGYSLSPAIAARGHSCQHDDKSRKRVAKKYGDMPDKWDDWHVRLLDPKDQIRVIYLYQKSSSMSKSEFVRARLLGEHFKVITVDKSAVEYYRKLSELTAQVHKIGTNYNQVVRLMRLYTAEKSAYRHCCGSL